MIFRCSAQDHLKSRKLVNCRKRIGNSQQEDIEDIQKSYDSTNTAKTCCQVLPDFISKELPKAKTSPARVEKFYIPEPKLREDSHDRRPFFRASNSISFHYCPAKNKNLKFTRRRYKKFEADNKLTCVRGICKRRMERSSKSSKLSVAGLKQSGINNKILLTNTSTNQLKAKNALKNDELENLSTIKSRKNGITSTRTINSTKTSRLRSRTAATKSSTEEPQNRVLKPGSENSQRPLANKTNHQVKTNGEAKTAERRLASPLEERKSPNVVLPAKRRDSASEPRLLRKSSVPTIASMQINQTLSECEVFVDKKGSMRFKKRSQSACSRPSQHSSFLLPGEDPFGTTRSASSSPRQHFIDLKAVKSRLASQTSSKADKDKSEKRVASSSSRVPGFERENIENSTSSKKTNEASGAVKKQSTRRITDHVSRKDLLTIAFSGGSETSKFNKLLKSPTLEAHPNLERKNRVIGCRSLDRSVKQTPEKKTVEAPRESEKNIVSILKRKEESGSSGSTSPITVLDSAVSKSKKQGILKKRSSLDESRYNLYFSNGFDKSRFTNNIRSNSLEEAHGILKQSSHERDSWHGILKKKDSLTLVSESKISLITQSVLESVDLVDLQDEEQCFEIKPILKQDSYLVSAAPKPILKKKISVEGRDSDLSFEEAVRPILKSSSRKSSRDEIHSDSDDLGRPILRSDVPKRRSLVIDPFEQNLVLERSRSLENSEPVDVAHNSPETMELPLVSVQERVRNMERTITLGTLAKQPLFVRKDREVGLKVQQFPADVLNSRVETSKAIDETNKPPLVRNNSSCCMSFENSLEMSDTKEQGGCSESSISDEGGAKSRSTVARSNSVKARIGLFQQAELKKSLEKKLALDKPVPSPSKLIQKLSEPKPELPKDTTSTSEPDPANQSFVEKFKFFSSLVTSRGAPKVAPSGEKRREEKREDPRSSKKRKLFARTKAASPKVLAPLAKGFDEIAALLTSSELRHSLLAFDELLKHYLI